MHMEKTQSTDVSRKSAEPLYPCCELGVVCLLMNWDLFVPSLPSTQV